MAADGVTPNSRINMGVIRAPPPAPVRPTRNPTMALPSTMYGSTCMMALLPAATMSRHADQPRADGSAGECYWLECVINQA